MGTPLPSKSMPPPMERTPYPLTNEAPPLKSKAASFMETISRKKNKNIFHTNKCNCRSPNVGVELPICEGNRYVFCIQFQNHSCFETAGAV